jgi:hypothetical protein
MPQGKGCTLLLIVVSQYTSPVYIAVARVRSYFSYGRVYLFLPNSRGKQLSWGEGTGGREGVQTSEWVTYTLLLWTKLQVQSQITSVSVHDSTSTSKHRSRCGLEMKPMRPRSLCLGIFKSSVYLLPPRRAFDFLQVQLLNRIDCTYYPFSWIAASWEYKSSECTC